MPFTSGSYTLGYEWQQIASPGQTCEVYAPPVGGVLLIDAKDLENGNFERVSSVRNSDRLALISYDGLYARAIGDDVVVTIRTQIT